MFREQTNDIDSLMQHTALRLFNVRNILKKVCCFQFRTDYLSIRLYWTTLVFLSDHNVTQTHNHLVHKRTLNHL